MRNALLCCLLLAPLSALADDAEVRQIAETYLKATTGEGDEAGKELLLGGVSMDASLFSLENGRIVGKNPTRREKGDLASATKLVGELDRTARENLSKVSGDDDEGKDDLQMTELSAAEAAKVMKPTKAKADALLRKHPVLAYALRIGKDVYWHPKNPMRPVLRKAGKNGQYSIEVHRFEVQSFEGPRKSPRKWGLKVIRFETDALDTGWKILPAADWSVE